LAQADLFATVVLNLPVWEPAGFIISTVGLVDIGVVFFKNKSDIIE